MYRGLGFGLVLLALSGCSREGGPTSPSVEIPQSQAIPDSQELGSIPRTPAMVKAVLRTGTEARSLADALEADEDFNCQNVEKVRVRFGPPGYVEGLEVGLFVNFEGMPPGEKKLRLFWDLDRHPEIFQDVRIGEGEERNDGIFDFEDVLTHDYRGVGGSAEYKVRVELIMNGQTGNCSRNRVVSVFAEPAPSGPAGPPLFTSQTINGDLTFLSPFFLYRDVYKIVATPGTVLTVSVDTVSSTTTFDPGFSVFHDPPPSIFASGFWNQDDDFVCTFAPLFGLCPAGTLALPADADGVYYLSLFDLFTRAGPVGSYVLTVNSSVPIPAVVQTEDDTPM
jgi:hypothetical protein